MARGIGWVLPSASVMVLDFTEMQVGIVCNDHLSAQPSTLYGEEYGGAVIVEMHGLH